MHPALRPLDSNPYRLSRNVLPTRYDLELTPNFKDFTFESLVKIDLAVSDPTDKITLNALDIKINNAWLFGENSRLPAKNIVFNQELETVTFEFDGLANKQGSALVIESSGELNDKMHGFYRTKYFVDGQERWGAATQFEATDARRCFPCFDEPDMKAEFTVHLNVPTHMTALSNMPAADESFTEDIRTKYVTFQPTPKMSTYLLAFIAMEMEYIEGVDRNGIPIRAYTVPGKKEWGRFGLEVALHALPFFADYYKIDYPLPKLDLVALPDFAAGAMENWGLETFRETALLINPEEVSASAMERVADVVAHELAHHWFGNRTTMKWFTHLWLNEGFATFAEMLAVSDKFPQWKRRVRFVAEDVLGAMHDMDKQNSHAIELEVKNPAEIREMFDTTTYSGGSAVCNMIEGYLSPEGFAKGVSKYLGRYAYDNAETNDLWRELGEANNRPVEAIMSSYTRQAGYPVLIVKEHIENQATSWLDVTQQRFLFDGSKDEAESLWSIPLGILTPGTTPRFLHMSQKSIAAAEPSLAWGWVKLNPGHNSLYRTAYSPRMWGLLANAVRQGKLPEADRLGLLDDAFALARAGHISTPSAMDLLIAYKNEISFYVWTIIAGAVGAINGLMHGDRDQFLAAKLGQNLFYTIAKWMTWDKPKDRREENPEILLRALAIRNLGRYGKREVAGEAKNRFADYLRGRALDPDMRGTAFALVCENGDNETFEQILQIYDRTDDHQEKIRVLRALGAFKAPDVAQKVLAFSLSSKVRTQDTPILLTNIGSNDDVRKMTWEFIKTNWGELERRYHGGGFGSITRVLQETTSGFITTEDLADVEKFFGEHKVPGAERAMAQSLEEIRSNISWRARDLENIREWFAQNTASVIDS